MAFVIFDIRYEIHTFVEVRNIKDAISGAKCGVRARCDLGLRCQLPTALIQLTTLKHQGLFSTGDEL